MDSGMTLNLDGLTFSIYAVRGQWKVAHGIRSNGRISRGFVRDVASEAEGERYAREYAATHK